MRVSLLYLLVLSASVSSAQSLLTNAAVHSDAAKKQAEAHLAVARDTGGTVHAVAMYRNQWSTFQKIGHWYSSNEGSSWPTGGDSLPPDNGAQNDPNVAFDVSRGYAYATFLTSTDRFLSYSTNWGATWNATSTQSTGIKADAPVIAVDNDPTSAYFGAVYIATSDSVKPDSSAVTIIRSTDQGGSDTIIAKDVNHQVGVHDDINNVWNRRSTVPQLAVGKGGVLYLASWLGRVNYSTNGGVTWGHGKNGNDLFTAEINVDVGGHKFLSMACLPTSDTVLFAYEKDGVIKFCYSNDSGYNHSTERSVTLPGLSVAEPAITIDDNRRIYVAYFGVRENVVNLYVAVSSDFGVSWRRYVVTTQHSLDAGINQLGVGDYCGISALDSEHVYLAWGDRRDQSHDFQLFFAKFSTKGIQFRNELSGIYAVGNHILDAGGTPDTIPSLTIHNFTTTATHTSQPDSRRYANAIAPHGSNFRYAHWNSSSAPGDTAFQHSFSGNVGQAGSQEANFTHVDTCRVVNDCDGLIDHGGVGLKLDVDTTWVSGTSPVFIDTALRFPKTYVVRADSTQISFSNLTFDFERWATGSTDLNNPDLISVHGDTTIRAFFKGRMRSTNALFFNNQRKLAWDSCGTNVSRYFFTYSSHGNVYLTRSTDTTSTPGGCHWTKDTLVNDGASYGKCAYPSVACLLHDTSDFSAGHHDDGAIVTWEDTAAYSEFKTRSPKYSLFDRYGKEVQDNLTIPGTYHAKFPLATMACAVRPFKPLAGLGTFYADAAVVFCDDTSALLALIGTSCVVSGVHVERIPNSAGARQASIEPGHNRDSVQGARHDLVDFEISWYDASGVKNCHANLGCTACDASHVLCYNTPVNLNDTAWKGVNINVSMAVSDSVEPGVAWEHRGSRVLIGKTPSPYPPYDNIFMYDQLFRSGISTRARKQYNSAWGGTVSMVHYEWPFMEFASVVEYSSVVDSTKPPIVMGRGLHEPQLSFYHDQPNVSRMYWERRYSTSPTSFMYDSLTFWVLNLSPYSSDVMIPDSLMTLVGSTSAHTPQLPVGRNMASTNHRPIWAADTAYGSDDSRTFKMRRESCSDPTNQVPFPGSSVYDLLCVRCNDSAVFNYQVGEYKIIDSLGSHDVFQRPMSALEEVTSISTATAQTHSAYFHIRDNSVKIAAFIAPMINDTQKTIQVLGFTGQLQFKLVLRDSASGTILQELSHTHFMGGMPYYAGAFGADTAVVVGRAGTTCYMQLLVDTIQVPVNTVFDAAQEIVDTALSVVAAAGPGGFAKTAPQEMRDAGRSGVEPVTGNNPIHLTIVPNPLLDFADFQFDVPPDDGDAMVELLIFDMAGHDVATLVREPRAAGHYSARFGVSTLPSGEYAVAVHTATHMESKLMVVTH